MTKKAVSKISDSSARGKPDSQVLQVGQGPDETEGEAMARVLLNPNARHGHVAIIFAASMLGMAAEKPGIMDCSKFVKARGDKAVNGDLEFASRMLAAQATTLDAMFTEFARRAHLNFPNNFDASERFTRLAMKAQSNSRTTLETLAKLHQPREQTVRHIHVNEGGQAIVADQFHNHTGGRENAKSADQPHEQGASGTALLGPDPLGKGLPIASLEGKEALPVARGAVTRSAKGQS
jgi:hypothetical protein